MDPALGRVFTVAAGPDIHHLVTFRDGPEAEDKRGWTAAKLDKWIRVHGTKFVPDVLVRRTFSNTEALSLEVKLAKTAAFSQAIAAAVGQCFAYRTRYPRAILFVGVARGVVNTRVDGFPLDSPERSFRETLRNNGISLVFREVSLRP